MDNTLRQDMQSSFLPTQLYSYNTVSWVFFWTETKDTLVQVTFTAIASWIWFQPILFAETTADGPIIPRVMSCCKARFYRHFLVVSAFYFGIREPFYTLED